MVSLILSLFGLNAIWLTLLIHDLDRLGQHKFLSPLKADQLLDQLYSLIESVSVIRVTVQSLRPNHKIIFGYDGNNHLASKLALLMRFAFSNTLHLRHIQAVKFIFVHLFLFEQSLPHLQLWSEPFCQPRIP